jgi:predicted phage terminase large subunit-like protein
VTLNAIWRQHGLRAIYIEDRASGHSIIQELKRQSGLSVIPYKVVNDKVARVNSILPIIEGGRVFLPEAAPWLDTFIEEATSFPSAKHDDQIDAVTMGIDVLSRTGIMPEDFEMHLATHTSLNQLYNQSKDPTASKTERNMFDRSIRSVFSHSRWTGWGQ